MTDQLLDILVQVLVRLHGRQRLLAALARLVEQTPEELEQQLEALRQKPAVGQKKEPKSSLVEVARSVCGNRTEILEPLNALAVAFENRSFLPNLRDAQRFLDRAGAPSQKLKSRLVAGPVVIRTLAKLPKDELVSLAARGASGRESDYALLSRAIMGGLPDDKAGQE